jgi:hypothetical protein
MECDATGEEHIGSTNQKRRGGRVMESNAIISAIDKELARLQKIRKKLVRKAENGAKGSSAAKRDSVKTGSRRSSETSVTKGQSKRRKQTRKSK